MNLDARKSLFIRPADISPNKIDVMQPSVEILRKITGIKKTTIKENDKFEKMESFGKLSVVEISKRSDDSDRL
jgi:hypothetical protein